MKKIFFAIILLASFSASADFGVGALLGASQDYWSASGPNLDSVKASNASTRWGVMGWIPLVPTLSLRIGYLIENQEIESSSFSGATKTTTKFQNHVIPLNAQWALPGTDLYAFGGLLFVGNDKIDPDAGYKAGDDTRLNIGAGYKILGFGIGDLSVEAEYQHGLRNISPSPGFDLKSRAIGLNAVAQFGF